MIQQKFQTMDHDIKVCEDYFTRFDNTLDGICKYNFSKKIQVGIFKFLLIEKTLRVN